MRTVSSNQATDEHVLEAWASRRLQCLHRPILGKQKAGGDNTTRDTTPHNATPPHNAPQRAARLAHPTMHIGGRTKQTLLAFKKWVIGTFCKFNLAQVPERV